MVHTSDTRDVGEREALRRFIRQVRSHPVQRPNLFVAAGATNVLWIFCPNDSSVPSDSWNQWQNYYRGDAYVDWMGFDGYNWGTVQSTSTWQTFPTIASQIYASPAAKGKPITIPETASTELGGDKAAWIAGILPSLKTTFAGIKALAGSR
jgi:beta-mannanase